MKSGKATAAQPLSIEIAPSSAKQHHSARSDVYTRQIVNVSEIHPTLGFTEFDILEKYRKSCLLYTSPNVPNSLSKDAALELVRNERRIELAAEGHRYDDIRLSLIHI